jgi:hypothetical protein
MAEPKPQRSKAKKPAAARASRAKARGREATVQETAQLSKDIARSVEDGQRAAIDAVQRFIDSIDHTLPALPHGEGPSRRQEIIDAALQMADRLVHTQYEFIRKVVEETGASLERSRSK